ncbi:hypothetical protein [Paraburkholderia tropica]|uniref:hypothetical protein n=1 Tax=Paraburkholderia tropica TaxID=92647 RepID=UPI002AB0A107|nr:hypothetical protein [Paraburkholderia tropica]
MTDQKLEQLPEMASTYLEHLKSLYEDVREWCAKRGLQVVEGAVEMNEQGLPHYEAPKITITRDGAPVAELVPLGAAIIGARGRVDLKGRLSRHAFLFQVGRGPSITIRATHEGSTSHDGPARPMIQGIDGDGWYWLESHARRAKRVDEALFGDLLADVSDYDFQ